MDYNKFAEKFNTDIRKRHKKEFPYKINVENFIHVFENIEYLSGSKDIELTEFIGYFSIFYNETGGTFRTGIAEQGGLKYMFEPNNRGKMTYNKTPNRLAGDQLEEIGIFQSLAEKKHYNGSYLPSQWKLLEPQLKECDFYKFRGRGLNQLTWMTAYAKYVNPLLEKGQTINDLTEKELTAKFQNVKFALAVVRNYNSGSKTGKKAISDLKKGQYKGFGMLVSGNWWRYVRDHYLPRCKALDSELVDYDVPKIQELGLVPSEIKIVQELLNDILPKNQIKVDGWMGDETQEAFDSTGYKAGEMIIFGVARGFIDLYELRRELVIELQSFLLTTSQKNIINDSGGVDGIAGNATKQAVHSYISENLDS